jgi:hypothetical protein
MKVKQTRYLLKLVFLLFGLSTAIQAVAAGSEINFNSAISAIDQTDTNAGTVTVTIYGFDVEVVVNPGTDIEAAGEQIGIGDLAIGDIVRIDAFLSDEGITADEIRILEAQFEQFRIRGLISAASTLDNITTVTVLGVDINADADTHITRRGSGLGNSVPASELEVGQMVNIAGGLVDNFLYATRIHVGSRPTGDIEVEGNIVEIFETEGVVTSIVMELGSDVFATVLIDDDTHVGGDLIVDRFVEVEGMLDEALNVIAWSIIVDLDGDGDADDDFRRGPKKDKPGNGGDGSEIEVGAKISLSSDTDPINGSAKFKYEEDDDEVEQEFEVEIEDAAANETYNITVLFGATEVNFGALETNSEGSAEKEFSNDPEAGEVDLAPLLPVDTDVRDITAIEITLDSSVVLDGEF